MDVLNPPIIRIGKRLYRKNPSRATTQTVPVGYLEDDDEEMMRLTADDVEKPCSDRNLKTIYLVEQISADSCGSFHATLYVPVWFHGLIIGPKGSVIHQLEKSFASKLKIQSGNPKIKIMARTEVNILALVNRIEYIVSDGRCTLRPSHFVCIPCNHPNTVEAFTKLKAEVLAKAEGDTKCLYHNIDEDLFIKGTKLHFTLVTLLLVDQREIDLASSLLVEFGREHLRDKKPLKLTVRGFDCMNDDPKFMNILYAKLQNDEETARLQSLANSLVDVFMRHGLCSDRVREPMSVKLHLTLMNSRYRSTRLEERLQVDIQNDSHKRSQLRPEPFSGIGILQDFAEHILLKEGLFDEIQLCSMSRDDDNAQTGFYKCLAKLNWGSGNN